MFGRDDDAEVIRLEGFGDYMEVPASSASTESLWRIVHSKGSSEGGEGARSGAHLPADPVLVLECVENGADVCYFDGRVYPHETPLLHQFIARGLVECVAACLTTSRPIDFRIPVRCKVAVGPQAGKVGQVFSQFRGGKLSYHPGGGGLASACFQGGQYGREEAALLPQDSQKGKSNVERLPLVGRTMLHEVCGLASPVRCAAILTALVRRLRRTTGGTARAILPEDMPLGGGSQTVHFLYPRSRVPREGAARGPPPRKGMRSSRGTRDESLQGEVEERLKGCPVSLSVGKPMREEERGVQQRQGKVESLPPHAAQSSRTGSSSSSFSWAKGDPEDFPSSSSSSSSFPPSLSKMNEQTPCFHMPHDLVDWTIQDDETGLNVLSHAAYHHLLFTVWPILRHLPFFARQIKTTDGRPPNGTNAGRIVIDTAVFPLDWDLLSDEDRSHFSLPHGVLSATRALARLSRLRSEEAEMAAGYSQSQGARLEWTTRYIQAGADVLFQESGCMNRPILHEYIYRGDVDAVLACLQTPRAIDFTLDKGRGRKNVLHLLCRVKPTEKAVGILRGILCRLYGCPSSKDDQERAAAPLLVRRTSTTRSELAEHPVPACPAPIWVGEAVRETSSEGEEDGASPRSASGSTQRPAVFSSADASPLVCRCDEGSWKGAETCSRGCPCHARHPDDRVDWFRVDADGHDFLSLAADYGILSAVWPLVKDRVPDIASHSRLMTNGKLVITTGVQPADWSALDPVDQARFTLTEALIPIRNPTAYLERHERRAIPLVATRPPPPLLRPQPAASLSVQSPQECLEDILRRCVGLGADVTQQNFWTRPLLHQLIRWGQVKSLAIVLLHTTGPIDFTIQSSSGRGGETAAATGGALGATSAVTARTERGNNPFHWVCRVEDPYKAVAMLTLLVDRLEARPGVDIVDWEQVDDRGHNFASCAAGAGYLSLFWPVLQRVRYFIDMESRGYEPIRLTCAPSVEDWEQLKKGGIVLTVPSIHSESNCGRGCTTARGMGVSGGAMKDEKAYRPNVLPPPSAAERAARGCIPLPPPGPPPLLPPAAISSAMEEQEQTCGRRRLPVVQPTALDAAERAADDHRRLHHGDIVVAPFRFPNVTRCREGGRRYSWMREELEYQRDVEVYRQRESAWRRCCLRLPAETTEEEEEEKEREHGDEGCCESRAEGEKDVPSASTSALATGPAFNPQQFFKVDPLAPAVDADVYPPGYFSTCGALATVTSAPPSPSADKGGRLDAESRRQAHGMGGQTFPLELPAKADQYQEDRDRLCCPAHPPYYSPIWTRCPAEKEGGEAGVPYHFRRQERRLLHWGTSTLRRLCVEADGAAGSAFPVDLDTLHDVCVRGEARSGLGIGVANIMYHDYRLDAPLFHQLLARGAVEAVMTCLQSPVPFLDFTLTDAAGNTPLHLVCSLPLQTATEVLAALVTRIATHHADRVDWLQLNRENKDFLTLVVEHQLLAVLWPVLRDHVGFFQVRYTPIRLSVMPSRWDWEQLTAEDQCRFELPPRENEGGRGKPRPRPVYKEKNEEDDDKVGWDASPRPLSPAAPSPMCRTAALGVLLAPYLEFHRPPDPSITGPLLPPLPPILRPACSEELSALPSADPCGGTSSSSSSSPTALLTPTALSNLILIDGGDVMYQTWTMKRPVLHELVYRGEVEAVKICLQTPHTIDFTKCGWFGKTVLHLICEKHPPATSVLHSADEKPDSVTSGGEVTAVGSPGKAAGERQPPGASKTADGGGANECGDGDGCAATQADPGSDIAVKLLQAVLERLGRSRNADRVDWSQRDAHGHDFIAVAAAHRMLSKVWPLIKYVPYYAARSAPLPITTEVCPLDWAALRDEQKYFTLMKGIAVLPKGSRHFGVTHEPPKTRSARVVGKHII